MADFSLQLVMQSIKNSSKLIGQKSALCLVFDGFLKKCSRNEQG